MPDSTLVPKPEIDMCLEALLTMRACLATAQERATEIADEDARREAVNALAQALGIRRKLVDTLRPHVGLKQV